MTTPESNGFPLCYGFYRWQMCRDTGVDHCAHIASYHEHMLNDVMQIDNHLRANHPNAVGGNYLMGEPLVDWIVDRKRAIRWYLYLSEL